MNVLGFSSCSNGPVWQGVSKYKINLSYMILSCLLADSDLKQTRKFIIFPVSLGT